MAWGNVGVLETAATMTTATMAITKPVIYMEGRGRKKWIQVVGRWERELTHQDVSAAMVFQSDAFMYV